jgi:hypothetical protein
MEGLEEASEASHLLPILDSAQSAWSHILRKQHSASCPVVMSFTVIASILGCKGDPELALFGACSNLD